MKFLESMFSKDLRPTSRVGWIGAATVMISVELLMFSHVLYVKARNGGVPRDLIVAILDDAGIAGLVCGMVLLVASALMPIVRRRHPCN